MGFNSKGTNWPHFFCGSPVLTLRPCAPLLLEESAHESSLVAALQNGLDQLDKS
jgi:hypothetical protein